MTDTGETLSVADGTLSVVVWPVYIGAALAGSTPPFTVGEPHNSGYERGTILWTPVPDERQVIGKATIVLPPGVYTHLLFFHHPSKPLACGVSQLDHPVRCTEPLTYLTVDPIVNNDLTLATAEPPR